MPALPSFETNSIINYLQKILNNPELLAVIASRSYIHDNGFIKIVLDDSGPSKHRIHLYPAGGMFAAENLHDHRWRFTSLVLVGSLPFQLATVSPDSEGDHARFEYVRNEDGTFSLSDTGELYSLDSVTSDVHDAGAIYVMETDTIHRILAHTNFTATYVVTEPPTSTNCSQWNLTGADVGQRGSNQSKDPLEPSEVKEYLRALLSELAE